MCEVKGEAMCPDVQRRFLSRAARDHEIADEYLHGLAVLI
jgi:hypothetical protein